MSTTFQIGDKVKLTDRIAFQFGSEVTHQQGEVIGVIGTADEGFQIVATRVDPASFGYVDEGVRIDYVYPDIETPLVKVEGPVVEAEPAAPAATTRAPRNTPPAATA